MTHQDRAIEVLFVLIGRNEGQRLVRCIDSLPAGATAVYVDSGSADGSAQLARARGLHVIELDGSRPYSAARARNAGAACAESLSPRPELVQFIDGDCSLADQWIETAIHFLDAHSDCGVVCGRRRERFPRASIYNRLADMEWNTPVGETLACGGDSLMRVSALKQVGGFNDSVIAGEEPELCVRLRRAGWRIFRIDAEMSVHDAAMTRFSQWWRRTMRGGYAYAMGASMHGTPPERHWVRETRSILFWGLILPVASFVLLRRTHGVSGCLLTAYPILGWRVFRWMRGRAFPAPDALLYALFCVLGKFPQAMGVLRFRIFRAAVRPSPIIEYRSAASAARL